MLNIFKVLVDNEEKEKITKANLNDEIYIIVKTINSLNSNINDGSSVSVSLPTAKPVEPNEADDLNIPLMKPSFVNLSNNI